MCEHCVAIAEDRHVDVIEMDAASRTGVDDIRELIEGVRYRPVAARYKVYIIDEVHMLSKNAFNALLKTLEEPPAHVKFVFATTEIRKVPITVLSRCQRFDLRRRRPASSWRRISPASPARRARGRARRARRCSRAPPTARCATGCRCSTRRIAACRRRGRAPSEVREHARPGRPQPASSTCSRR